MVITTLNKSSKPNIDNNVTPPFTVKTILGSSITDAWHQYKERIWEQTKLKPSSFNIRDHLQEILSLSHTLLLTGPSAFNASLLPFIDQPTQSFVYNHLYHHHVNFQLKVDPSLVSLLKNSIVNALAHRTYEHLLTELHEMKTRAPGLDAIIFKAIESCIQSMPMWPTIHCSQEDNQEIIMRYLSLILKNLFQDTDMDMYFFWAPREPNLDPPLTRASILDRDGTIFQLHLGGFTTLGICLVSPLSSSQQTIQTDLFHLACLAKEIIDSNLTSTILAIHLNGIHASFYLCTLIDHAMYPMLLIGQIDIPTSIIECLPTFIDQMDTLKRIVDAFQRLCHSSPPSRTILEMKRDSYITFNDFGSFLLLNPST